MDQLDRIASARISRRRLLKGAGAVGLGVMAAQAGILQHAGLIRSVAADSEGVTDIINIAATAEAMAVTLLGGAIDSAKHGSYNKPIPDAVIAILQAARSEEQYHLSYLQSAGAKPLTETFTVPDTKILTDTTTLFKTIVALETAFIAAYMAAAREFADMKQPSLVKVAYQIGAVEAEHHVLANYALGTRPANDVAFEKAMFATVGDAAKALQQLGFIGGSGPKVTYPGPGTINNSNVSETTPSGPAVDCTAPASPPPPATSPTAPSQPKPGCDFFPQTSHNLSGGFRDYWKTFGGLAISGFPLTEEFQEKNPDDGKTYTVRYFERARFEWHPGAWPQQWDVELGRLGAQVLAANGS